MWLEGRSVLAASGGEQLDELWLSHGPLSYAYKLYKIELHSAVTSTQPQQQQQQRRTSEHTIDGRAFDAEIQMHFYNKHLASSAREAARLAADDAARAHLFAAIAVFVIATPDNNNDDDKAANATEQPLDFLLNRVQELANQHDSLDAHLSRAHIDALVPERREYVTYSGSLNKPPCAEAVDWIISNKAVRVRAAALRELLERPNTSQDNVRPARPLNARLLRTTINMHATPLAAADTSQQPQADTSATNRSGCDVTAADSAHKVSVRVAHIWSAAKRVMDTRARSHHQSQRTIVVVVVAAISKRRSGNPRLI